jgi:orotidine-5'-phosphate decarboxylase
VHFADRLFHAVKSKQNAVMVGIDPRVELLPELLRESASRDRAGVGEAFARFGKELTDVVAPLVPAVKLQAAFYEMYGFEGIRALWDTVQYARSKGLIATVDGKRNDIGSTAEAYARAYLGKTPIGDVEVTGCDADALTVNPYLGFDGVRPFVETAAKFDKGVFALLKTSNPSSGEIQDVIVGDQPLYRVVAKLVSQWGEASRGELGYSLLGAVVGATYRDQLTDLRAAAPSVPFLVPGYGAQGGTAPDVAPAFDRDGLGAVISNSRRIAFAYTRPELRERFRGNWQAAVEFAVREMIDELATETPCGRLRTSKADEIRS